MQGKAALITRLPEFPRFENISVYCDSFEISPQEKANANDFLVALGNYQAANFVTIRSMWVLLAGVPKTHFSFGWRIIIIMIISPFANDFALDSAAKSIF